MIVGRLRNHGLIFIYKSVATDLYAYISPWRNYAEKLVWSLCRMLNIIRVGLNNVATLRILVNPAVIPIL